MGKYKKDYSRKGKSFSGYHTNDIKKEVERPVAKDEQDMSEQGED